MLKVSVITCVYNGEKYLKKCIDSILNQSEKDIELILINDGSTDDTEKICKSYLRTDTRITYIKQENKGVSAARNKAMEIAKGQYIQFVDADDWLDVNAVELIYNAANEKDLDMISFSALCYDDKNQEFIKENYYFFQCFPDDFDKDIYTYRDCKGFIFNLMLAACLTVYKREFLIKHRITWIEGKTFEDLIFFRQALFNAKRMGKLPVICYYRRQHSLSVSANFNTRYLALIDILEILYKYLCDFGTDNSIKREFLIYMLSRTEAHYLDLDIIYQHLYFEDLKRFYEKFYAFENQLMRHIHRPFLFLVINSDSYEVFALKYGDFKKKMQADNWSLSDPKEEVQRLFLNGKIGFRYIIKYLNGWMKYKIISRRFR